MFGSVVEGRDDGGKTVFSCISYEIGVYCGFRRIWLVRLCGVRPCPLS
jgi:hypothetical protein